MKTRHPVHLELSSIFQMNSDSCVGEKTRGTLGLPPMPLCFPFFLFWRRDIGFVSEKDNRCIYSSEQPFDWLKPDWHLEIEAFHWSSDLSASLAESLETQSLWSEYKRRTKAWADRFGDGNSNSAASLLSGQQNSWPQRKISDYDSRNCSLTYKQIRLEDLWIK